MGATTMKEWIVVPDSFYDDEQLLSAWAKKSHALAPAKKGTKKAAKAPKAPNKKAPPKAARKAPSKKAPKKSSR
jgi:hypothetical protein